MLKTKHPLYSVWRGMITRCYMPGTKVWRDYGARGITVCDRWRGDFWAFVEDIGVRPPGTSIGRIDNDGNYEPGNCRWETRSQQQRNRRVSRRVVVEGVTYLAIELADRAGVKIDTIVERAARGMSMAEVLSREKMLNLDGLALGGLANGARQRAKTHCAQGHPFDAENTYYQPGPKRYRECRTCQREKGRRLRALRRLAA